MVCTVDKDNKFSFQPITADDIHKIHERLLDDRMYTYFSDFFQYQCGFREGYSAQHRLLAMTEKMKEV